MCYFRSGDTDQPIKSFVPCSKGSNCFLSDWAIKWRYSYCYQLELTRHKNKYFVHDHGHVCNNYTQSKLHWIRTYQVKKIQLAVSPFRHPAEGHQKWYKSMIDHCMKYEARCHPAKFERSLHLHSLWQKDKVKAFAMDGLAAVRMLVIQKTRMMFHESKSNKHAIWTVNSLPLNPRYHSGPVCQSLLRELCNVKTKQAYHEWYIKNRSNV